MLSALLVVCWPLGPYWPAFTAVPVLVYLGVSRKMRGLRPSDDTFARGEIRWGWVLGFSVVSTAGLLGWLLLLRPDLGPILERMPAIPGALLPVAALGFATINAAVEEALFRGLLYDRLRAATTHRWLPHVGQAAVFGLIHWQGVPSGIVGMVLAGGWGLGLSLLRDRTGGLWTPWLAHVAADLCIFALLFCVPAT